MKRLFISIDTIFPPNSGYRKSVLGRIHESVLNGDQTFVIEFDIGENNTTPSIFQGADFFRFYHPWTRSRFRKNLANFLSLFSPLTRLQQFYSHTHFQSNISTLIEAIAPDEIIFESLWLSSSIPDHSESTLILVSHDNATQYLYEMAHTSSTFFKRIMFYIDYLKLKRTERGIYTPPHLQHVFLTEADRIFYTNEYQITRTQLATNLLYLPIPVKRKNPSENFFLFTGSILFAQNEYALRWYADKVIPAFRALSQGIEIPILYVTGKITPEKIKPFEHFRFIQFLGELSEEELVAKQASCLALLSPIITGTGIKIKNLEAAQKSIPVIMTPHSAQGIPNGANTIIAASDSPEDYALTLFKYLHSSLNDV